MEWRYQTRVRACPRWPALQSPPHGIVSIDRRRLARRMQEIWVTSSKLCVHGSENKLHQTGSLLQRSSRRFTRSPASRVRTPKENRPEGTRPTQGCRGDLGSITRAKGLWGQSVSDKIIQRARLCGRMISHSSWGQNKQLRNGHSWQNASAALHPQLLHDYESFFFPVLDLLPSRSGKDIEWNIKCLHA